jgi:hypothetical protein
MVNVLPQTYDVVDVASLTEHPNNPRNGNLEAIGESLEENGFYGAVIVQKSTGYILKGNHTFRVAKDKGLSKLPVILLDVNDARAHKIMLADNRVPELAGYDFQALRDALDVVYDESQSYVGTGFDDEAYNLVLNQINQEGDLSFIKPERFDVTNASASEIDDPSQQTDAQEVVPRAQTDAGMVTFTLVLTPEQRDVVLAAAESGKEVFEASTSSEAIYEICNAFVEAGT